MDIHICVHMLIHCSTCLLYCKTSQDLQNQKIICNEDVLDEIDVDGRRQHKKIKLIASNDE